MKKFNAWILCIWFAIKSMFQTRLGDYVLYKGKKYIISNGVRSGCWRLPDLDNGDSGWVERSDCKKIWSLKGLYNSFITWYKFYDSCWLAIWSYEGLNIFNWKKETYEK